MTTIKGICLLVAGAILVIIILAVLTAYDFIHNPIIK